MRLYRGILLICLPLLAGCATTSTQRPPEKITARDQQFAIRNQGYSLLYRLLSDEKNVSKLLIVKKEEADTGALLREIAEVAGAAAKQLEQFSRNDSHLHLDMPGLPTVESQTREIIGKLHTKELVAKGGEKFELRMLLTQVESLRYGAALCAAIAPHDNNESRRTFLVETQRRLEALHQKLIDLMHARWRMPAPAK